MSGEWILFVGGTHLHEMIVGALSIAAAGAFLYSVERTNTSQLRFTIGDVLTCWRVPRYILSDLCDITAVLVRDVLTIQPARSLYRVSRFEADKTDPLLAARRVLATAYTSAAPNSIVIGVDYEQRRMLFHQLKRSSIPKMTKALGASAYPGGPPNPAADQPSQGARA
jgi:hypothetical protein